MKTLNSKEIIAIWFAVVAALVSITALWMPPQGIIDETVLILIGQFLLFIGTLIGVKGQTLKKQENDLQEARRPLARSKPPACKKEPPDPRRGRANAVAEVKKSKLL